jgi:hypothetical protein
VPKKIKAYSCPTCTFLNQEGATSCEMCSSPAPASAIEGAPVQLAEVKEEAAEEDGAEDVQVPGQKEQDQ